MHDLCVYVTLLDNQAQLWRLSRAVQALQRLESRVQVTSRTSGSNPASRRSSFEEVGRRTLQGRRPSQKGRFGSGAPSKDETSTVTFSDASFSKDIPSCKDEAELSFKASLVFDRPRAADFAKSSPGLRMMLERVDTSDATISDQSLVGREAMPRVKRKSDRIEVLPCVTMKTP
eukprot:Skav219300  [mRNA]  locus=scaffold2157:510372:520237:- [translate_table: standard]